MSGRRPEPGAIWVTPNGVRMAMPSAKAAKPYIRLDYTLGGQRRQGTAGKADNWEQAWEYACELDAQIADETARISGESSAVTVGMLAEAWVEAEGDSWSLRYKTANVDRLESVVVPALGSRRVAELTRADVRALVLERPSRSGRRHLWSLLSSMLHFGVDEGLVAREALQVLPSMKKVRPRKAAVTADAADPDSALTVEELDKLDDDHDEQRLKYIKRESAPGTDDVLHLVRVLKQPRSYASKHARKAYTAPDHYVLMFLVAAFCGLRQAEIWGLRGKDVDGSILHVRRQLTWVKSAAHWTRPKGNKQRDVFIEERVAEFDLRAMLAARAAEVGRDGLLFPTSTGRLFRRNNFARDVMNPLRATAWPGKRWTFHSLRHHYCRWLLDRGVSIQDVAELAGHSNSQVTWTMYISPNDDLMKRMATLAAEESQDEGKARGKRRGSKR